MLGVGFGIAVIIGNTIGAGIFRTPGSIAAQLPHPWLFLGVWILGGLYALLGAISLAELGAMIPRSGGQYVFARYALGEYAGFIVGWSDWISTCGSAAAVSLLIGKFAGALFPILNGDVRAVAVAAVIATAFAVLQWAGIVWGDSYGPDVSVQYRKERTGELPNQKRDCCSGTTSGDPIAPANNESGVFAERVACEDILPARLWDHGA